MIEIIGGTWAAGETKTFVINGQRLEILEAQYPVDVYLMDKAGAQLSVMKGSEASFFSAPSEGFHTVQVYSENAQSVRMFIGSGDAGTRRISSVVRVVDGNREVSKAGAAFSARGLANTAIATERAHSMLLNKAGSGKRIIIDAVAVSCSIAGSIIWGRSGGAPLGVAASTQAGNMLTAGPAPTASEIWTATTNGYVGSTVPLGGIANAAGVPFDMGLVRPIVLMPGQLLYITQDVLGAQTLLTTIQFVEETI